MLVAGDSVRVSGPPGYCVDTSSLRKGGDTAFVLLASCAAITGNPEHPAPGRPAVLTVAVAEETPGAGAQIDVLERLIASDAGRAALSRSGTPDSVEIIETLREKDALYIHARETGGPRGTRDDYWRALMAVNGRLITVSVLSVDSRPIPPKAGRETLSALTDRLRRINAAG